MITINKHPIKDGIIKILNEHPEGLSLQQIADFLNVSRNTAVKYIFGLEGEREIYRRRIGAVTLHYSKIAVKSFKKLIK